MEAKIPTMAPTKLVQFMLIILGALAVGSAPPRPAHSLPEENLSATDGSMKYTTVDGFSLC
jgi:hypothetical protein